MSRRARTRRAPRAAGEALDAPEARLAPATPLARVQACWAGGGGRRGRGRGPAHRRARRHAHADVHVGGLGGRSST